MQQRDYPIPLILFTISDGEVKGNHADLFEVKILCAPDDDWLAAHISRQGALSYYTNDLLIQAEV